MLQAPKQCTVYGWGVYVGVSPSAYLTGVYPPFCLQVCFVVAIQSFNL